MIDIVTAIELLANVGVLAGIVFLVIELRQNTRAVRSEASQGMLGQITNFYSLLTTDRVANVYRKAMTDADQLDPTERVIFNSVPSSLFASYENTFALINEGSFDGSRASGYWQSFRNLLENGAVRQHWERTRFIHNDAFREHVENYVMTLEPSGASTLVSVSE